MTNSVSIYDKKKRPGDMALLIVIYACAFLAVVLLVGIIGYVVYRGISVGRLAVYFHRPERPERDLWYPAEYHQYALHHCDYPADCHPDWDWLGNLPELNIPKAGAGKDD